MENQITNPKIGLIKMIPLALDSLLNVAQIDSLNEPLMFEVLHNVAMVTRENTVDVVYQLRFGNALVPS